ncbi:MAG: NAD(P)/FAD-dependent oxidoreductase [Candidatus Kapabacteria bacterium]|nr:NAD(P)/FAD-dependent oxidoreductase [Candidatus Kapabacteria bacterium]
MIYDVAIIGAGPAGIAAATQLKRQGMSFIIFEKSRVGGLILNANLIENYPGFPNGISGEDFSKLLDQHLNILKIDIIYQQVLTVSYNYCYTINTETDSYNSKYCIFACGTLPNKLQKSLLINDPKIHYDLSSLKTVRNADILIIGSGDAAFDYALSLSKYNNIHIFSRTEKMKCLPLLVHRAKLVKNIKIDPNIEIQNIKKTSAKTIVNFKQKGNDNELEFDYILAAIGRYPDSSLFETVKEIIPVNSSFVIGDTISDNCRQASISVGSGIKAAMQIFHKINF